MKETVDKDKFGMIIKEVQEYSKDELNAKYSSEQRLCLTVCFTIIIVILLIMRIWY